MVLQPSSSRQEENIGKTFLFLVCSPNFDPFLHLLPVPEDVQAELVCSSGAMPLLAGRGGGGNIARLLPL